jgi:hypothetical protein
VWSVECGVRYASSTSGSVYDNSISVLFSLLTPHSSLLENKGNHKDQSSKFKVMKKDTWKFIIQTVAAILTAIATSLGVTSCM